MAETNDGPRRVRAGHADRERAVGLLSDHFAEGRLDTEEFDRRATQATNAVYVDELRVLFEDLPGFGAAFGDDVVDGGPIGPAGPGSQWGPHRVPVPAYRADTRWAPPPPSRTRYDPPGTGPTPTPAAMGAVLTVTIVLVMVILVVATRGFAILPLIFVGLPFVFGGPRRRRPPF